MNKPVFQKKLLLACAALSVVGGGAMAVSRHNHAAMPIAPSTAAQVTIPTPTGHSATDQAIGRLSAKVQQESRDDNAWSDLGDALMQKARETADLSYYGHAEDAYQHALGINPGNTLALLGMAWVNGGRHEFEKSIVWANKVLAIDPKNHGAYGLIGDADVEMGRYDAALTHYQQMLDLRPDISSYSRGAHLLYLTGDTRKSVWLMSKAVNTGAPYAENTAWCRAQLGLMLFGDGQIIAAGQVLEQAEKQTPNNYHVLFALGKVKAARKDYPAAIDLFKRAVAVAPQHDALVALGDLYQLTGKKDEAEKQFALLEAIHKLNKANGVRGDIQMAQFYADHDRHLPEALALAQEEYKTRPNVAVADTLAWCEYKNRRYAEAKKHVAEALRWRATPEAIYLFHSGMINAALGDRPAAQIALYQALSQNPNFSPVFARVATDTLKTLGSRSPDVRRAVSQR